VHCIEFAPSGRRINPHTAASNMTDGEDNGEDDEEIEEIDVSAFEEL
jgi:hypothetical protein